MDNGLIQWHPAFYAGIQIELKDYSDSLTFENEHQLSKKPLAMDVLIIKNGTGRKITKNIGRIFRKYNIIEYKSPGDYIGVDDYYKTLAYAYLYKSDTAVSDSIGIDEITVTMVGTHYPRGLISHLEQEYGYGIEKADSGIYYLVKENSLLPIQFIVTSRLDYGANLWIAGLTDSLGNATEAHMMIEEYSRNPNNVLYEAVMDAVVKANEPIFRGGEFMCKALDELYKDAIDERVRELAKDMANELAKDMANELAKDMANEQLADARAKELAKDNEIAQLKAQIAEMQKKQLAN